MQVIVREMRPEEWADAQAVCIGAFDRVVSVLVLSPLGVRRDLHGQGGALVYADAFWSADAVGLRA